jgi:hypothetical protein
MMYVYNKGRVTRQGVHKDLISDHLKMNAHIISTLHASIALFNILDLVNYATLITLDIQR